MGAPGDGVRVGEVKIVGDFYRVVGETKDGRRGEVEIPRSTLDKMPRSQGEALIRRGIHGSAEQSR